jgi:hypothetical protein
MSLNVSKMTRLWSMYRTAVLFANRSGNVDMHQALFNIFCREFTFRVEMAFKDHFNNSQTGYETITLNQFLTHLKLNIVMAFESSSVGDDYLHDTMTIVTEATEDGRTEVRLFYRRDNCSWGLGDLRYAETFPMLNEIEREEVYAKFAF